MSLGFHVFGQVSFSFEGEVAVVAMIRTKVCMRADMFPQHTGLLAAYPTFLTDVLAPPSTPNIHVLFIRFKSPIEDLDSPGFNDSMIFVRITTLIVVLVFAVVFTNCHCSVGKCLGFVSFPFA